MVVLPKDDEDEQDQEGNETEIASDSAVSKNR
jgi:hypothetical protein